MNSTSTPPPYIAAVVQAAPCGFDTPATLRKVAMWTASARDQKAQLVVFPEAFVGSYPYGVDFGTKIGLRTPEGRELFARLHRAAVEVPGPEVSELGEIAKENNCHLVIGVVERAAGTLYSSTLFFSPEGVLLGCRRKLNSVGVERYVWGRGDGSGIVVFPTPLGDIGAIMGCENYMPPLRMAMYSKNMNLYCAPTTDDSDVWPCSMRTVAMEGRSFVLSACQVLRRSDLPDSYPIVNESRPDELLIRGGSCIVDPLGVVLAEPKYEEECVLTAEIDMAKVARGKYDFDVVGHYARADIFQLEVTESPQISVRPVTQPMEAIGNAATRSK
ncbi:carbon-nitrogen hydrolase family protein [Pollutimonas thiosulfatoxidans]|uniref:Nitrilase n=1 Tax=Pollutimonas thiosulfatoxidans TaxID=2028345 RepID=A0A410GD30_9BURK|nr:carbon-nitrogen hydrolase family protein [Pollutimonas thiosulfatoxidans]QAA94208.1 nitrilase [Pollutimonas thiosulfatoxidans]